MMKKIGMYFKSLFYKFDKWVFFILTIGFIGLLYLMDQGKLLVAYRAYVTGIIMSMAFGSVLLGCANLKNKTNLGDLIIIMQFFVMLYLSIAHFKLEPYPYALAFDFVMLGALIIVIIVRLICYRMEEIQSFTSKHFFGNFFHKMPIFPTFLLSLALSVGLYCLVEKLGTNFDAVARMVVIGFVLGFALIYCINNVMASVKSVNILDFFMMLLFCTSASYGIIRADYFDISSFSSVLVWMSMIIALCCLVVRSHTYQGEVEIRPKYFAKVFSKYQFYLPFLLAFGLVAVLAYYVCFPLSGFHVDLSGDIVFSVFAGILLFLFVLLLFTRKIKSKKVGATDYILLLLGFILFFTLSLVVTLFCNVPKIYSYLMIALIYRPFPKPEGFLGMTAIPFYCVLGVVAFCALVYVLLITLRVHYFAKQHAAAVGDLTLEERIEEVAKIAVEEEESPLEEVMPEENIVEIPVEEAPLKEEPMDEEIDVDMDEPEETDEEIEDEEELEEDEPLEEEKIEAVERRPRFVESVNIIVPTEEDNTAQLIKPRIKYETKLMFAGKDVKQYYSQVKNTILSYGVRSRVSSSKETFRKKGLLAVLKFAGKNIKIYLAVQPEPFINAGYKVKDVSDKKQYQDVPTMIKIKSKRALKTFLDVFEVMMQDREWHPKRRFVPLDYTELLIPNGEAVLNSLGYNSDEIVSSINLRILPNDLPLQLEQYVPTIKGEPLDEVKAVPVYLDTLCNYFEDGAVIKRENLLEKKIITAGNAILVKARGTLDRRFTIFADEFEPNAIKMIYITNGTAVRVLHEIKEVLK